MEATHIMSNPRSGKLGTINKDDDDDDDYVCQCPIEVTLQANTGLNS